MGAKKTGFYNAIYWLANHPDSTAYEVARGIGFADAWRVFDWLAHAEKQGITERFRRGSEITPRWRVVVGDIGDIDSSRTVT
jgi:hypothetical protein